MLVRFKQCFIASLSKTDKTKATHNSHLTRLRLGVNYCGIIIFIDQSVQTYWPTRIHACLPM